MELKDLEEYAELAKRILEDGTPYQDNKETIKPLFEEKVTNDEDFKKLVKKRLEAVAKYHSTTIRFNERGIDDLADALVEYSDEDLRNRANNFLTPTGDKEIKGLLYGKYGIDEAGEGGRIEISLVSAYLCFLTGDDFPICNNPAKYSYRVIKPKRSPQIDNDNFFGYIRELKKETKIEKYGTLDNLLWLMGNILYGSFRIIMSKEDRSMIVKKTKDQEKLLGKKNHRRKKDDIIRDYIRKNYKGSDLFTTDQKKFFDFAFDLYDTMELRIRSAYSRGGKP